MYINTLIQLKNAQAVRKDSVKIPYTNRDLDILNLLETHKFVHGVQKKGRMPKRVIEVGISYRNGKGAIGGIRIQSKPSLRRYVGYREIRQVRQGYGLVVLSTPKGIMTGGDARKAKVGGQVLFEIW
jgi:small subunit ribosomal protein S8